MAPTAFLLVGLPAAGKTTHARELATTYGAVRLTPDEWMIPLFGESDAGGRRDVLEGRLISVGLATLALGTSVVFDFGLWGREERAALRALVVSVRARPQTVYLPVDVETQRHRIESRFARAAHTTFAVTADELTTWRQIFAEPDAAELAGEPIGAVPQGWNSWPDWAVGRWPSLELPAPRSGRTGR